MVALRFHGQGALVLPDGVLPDGVLPDGVLPDGRTADSGSGSVGLGHRRMWVIPVMPPALHNP